MQVFKILRRPELEAFEKDGTTHGAPIDLSDGFIHFSTATQLAETLALHFSGENDLMILSVEAEALGAALRWEPSRGGDRFPHLYRKLSLNDVLWARPCTLGPGGHILPGGVL